MAGRSSGFACRPARPPPGHRSTPLIFLVDDDAGVRKALVRLFRSAGHAVEAFASAREFLARERPEGPGCLVLDLRMPGMTGLELQDTLERAGHAISVVFISGHADIPASVRAMKAGAIDFLTKPVRKPELLQAVERALARDVTERAHRAGRDAARASLRRLTPRERRVCDLVATGMLNKQIAAELGTSEKTIKWHRAHVMGKLGVGSVAELVRLVDRATPG
jgi:FixJ family two-component response regulator